MINIIQIIIPLIHTKIRITKMISKKDKMKSLGYMKDILSIKKLKINNFKTDYLYFNIYIFLFIINFYNIFMCIL